ncbi:MAG: MoaD/ThiS family protein [Bacillota bacterium]
MILEVRVFGGLEKKIPGAIYGKPIEMEAPGGTTVAGLLEVLKITEKDVFTVLVNGVHASREYVLNPGDRVAFFPPVGGG